MLPTHRYPAGGDAVGTPLARPADGEADVLADGADVLADDEAVGACDLAAEPPQLLTAATTARITTPTWVGPRTCVKGSSSHA